MKIADLFVKLGIRKEGFDSGINQAEKKTKRFGSSMKKLGGVIAGAFAVGAIIRFSKISMEKFNIQKQAETQLLVALKGRKNAQQELIKQAQELQKITLFGDEETIRAEALIAAFVREKEQIKQIIPLVQDFATAKSMNLAAAADLVSKTLGSSTNALTRYGITVKGAVGSTERLESTMKGLSDAFGGQAKAAALAGTGALKQFSNIIGDIEEKLGSILAKPANLALLRILNKLLGNLADTSKNLSKYVGSNGLLSRDWIKSQGLKEVSSELEIATKRYKTFMDFYNQAKAEGNTKQRQFWSINADIQKENIEQLTGRKKSLEIPPKGIEKAVTEAEAAKIALTDARQALTDFMAKGGKFHGEKSAQGFIDKMENLKKAIKDAETQYNTFKDTSKSGITKMDSVGINGPLNNLEPALSTHPPPIYSDQLEFAKKFTTDLNNIISSGVANAIGSLASGLGELAAGTITSKEFGNQVLQVVGNFMVQLGMLFITTGSLFTAFEEAIASMNGPLALAIGVALVAAGSAISGLAKKGFSGGSAGYAAVPTSGYNPSANQQSPLTGNVTFELQGTKLVGVLANTAKQDKLIG